MKRATGFQIHLAVKELADDGLRVREIIEKLKDRFALSYSKVVYYRDKYVPTNRTVKDYEVPLVTTKGVAWAKFPQGSRMTCEQCEMYKLCQEAVVRLDFIACEKPLEKELL